jgi:SIR2-like domain
VQKADDNWTELAWENLLYDIGDKRCIPFIGPGASEKWIQIDRIAKEWAELCHYPYSLQDSSQLPRVSQFLAIQEGDESSPKKMLSRQLKIRKSPVFSENSVYSVLANLHLPIYITTNYDHLMEDALRDKGKAPISDHSIWKDSRHSRTPGHPESSYPIDKYSDFETPEMARPTSANPLVFHLLGDIDNPASIVLTEKDYIDFAIYLSKMGDRYTLPHSIRQNLPNSTLLFVGYRLEDLSFLIVFEGFIKLMSSLESKGIAVQVQLPLEIEPEKKNTIRKYLDKFTESYFKIRIYWGDPDEFLEQLRNRWLKSVR